MGWKQKIIPLSTIRAHLRTGWVSPIVRVLGGCPITAGGGHSIRHAGPGHHSLWIPVWTCTRIPHGWLWVRHAHGSGCTIAHGLSRIRPIPHLSLIRAQIVLQVLIVFVVPVAVSLLKTSFGGISVVARCPAVTRDN